MMDETIITTSSMALKEGTNTNIFNTQEWIGSMLSNPEGLMLSCSADNPQHMNSYGCFLTNNVVSNCEYPVRTIGCTYVNSMLENEQEEYAYSSQKGKNRANMETELEREKRKERTVLSHRFTGCGYTRAKAFSDGTGMYSIVANGSIEKVQRWLIADKEFVRFLVLDTTPSYVKREGVWTESFEISELEKDKCIEELLSRYFKPSDSKVYNSASIKDFRSRLYEKISTTQLEKIRMNVGWYKLGNKRIYQDGSEFPKVEHILGRLRHVHTNVNFDICVGSVLKDVCTELKKNDIGNRLSFLIGYGIVTWFADVCSLNWDKSLGVVLLGRESVCRKYADACLKMCTRTTGTDIIEMSEIEKRELMEYVDVLKDDAFVMNCYTSSKSTLKLLNAIMTGRSVSNHNVNVPIVMLQNIPDNGLVYDKFVTIDLNGFEISESFCSKVNELKAILLSLFEAAVYTDEDKMCNEILCYEDVATMVFSSIKHHFLTSSLPIDLVDNFFSQLELGMRIKRNFCGNEKDALVYLFKQRMEVLIAKEQVHLTGECANGRYCDPKSSIIVKGNYAYIPAKYLEEVILGLMNISKSDFYRIRDTLIERQLLYTYELEKNYTKRITISKGERIYAYELNKELFFDFGNSGL